MKIIKSISIFFLSIYTYAQNDVKYINSQENIDSGYPFSEAVIVDNIVYLSGKVGRLPSGELVKGGIEAESKLINKPTSRSEAMQILKKLNGKKHLLISSVCISKNGSMIWNHTDKSELKMKNLSDKKLEIYLQKIKTETLLSYGVYQIEADGLDLFEYIKGDKNSIMGLPINEIKNYISNYNL